MHPSALLFTFFILLLGLVFGSFLNVLIYRLPRELGISKGFSQCTSCGHRLYPADLVPVFSYLLLRGRCRYCKERISPRYPIVELANALLYLAIALRYGPTVEWVFYSAVGSCLLVVLFIDWSAMIIPDQLNIAMLTAGILLIFFGSSHGPTPVDRIIGALSVSVPLLLIALLSGGRAMGGGDIKLMAALGLCLGWKLTVLTTVLGAIGGSLAFISLSKTRYALGREVPFGAFLALGGIVSILWGNAILSWYLGFLHIH